MAEPNNKSKKHFLSDIEEQVLRRWDKDKTYQKSVSQRKDGPKFTFYDGPPFANGVPHYGHLVQTTIKDTVTRYKTMRGYYVPRRVGWDTHGLPVEYAIEKEHDFRGKQDIIAYGVDKFNAECRESVFKYKGVWEEMFKRVGRWADYDNTYATLDTDYIESVWWVFKSLFDKGLIYKDFRSSPYCPRCATPLSNFELNQGYQDGIKDPSLYVKFKLADEDAYLVGWTTTPWSLPGNAAIAVKPDADYVYVRVPDENGEEQLLVMARERLTALNCDTYYIEREIKGRELVNKSYKPLFKLHNEIMDSPNLYKVWGAEFVSVEDGSGVLHIAPAFGEDDLHLAKEHGIPIFITVDEYGKLKPDAGLPTEIHDKFFKSADPLIIAHLTKEGNVYAAETFEHTYPFCWRCDTPLLYYATDSWLVRVTELKDQLLANNKKIDWTPSHIRDGRFGKWLENVRDWGISRNRFWGAPLPVWVTEDGEVTVIGSLAEIKELAIGGTQIDDLHRPMIDDVKIKTKSGKIATRIPEVFDCWFESGSMPYAQDHYPFTDKHEWEQHFPADFIAEAIDQTRGWFYTLHVLATALFDKPAFNNVICSGWVVAADGEKLSKRKKNYSPMDEVFDLYGVDTMRFFFASSPIVNGEDVRFSTNSLLEVQRNILMALSNIYNFYKLYAEVDGWKPPKTLHEPKSDNPLDRWMLSRLNQTIEEMTASMDDYRLDKAARPLSDLLDDTSNWFVRRSRRRFWKAEDDQDKKQAYNTLHYTLTRLCQLLAPMAPFLPDYLWPKLVESMDLPDSVHLSDWPAAGKTDKNLLEHMAKAREAITIGLAQRAEAKIKVRQPLAGVSVPQLEVALKDIVAEELNVKDVTWSKNGEVKVDTKLTDELKVEGVMRDLVRAVQNARKQADLQVDDRIKLSIKSTDKQIQKALKVHEDVIKHETLAKELTDNISGGFSTKVRIEGQEVQINLRKV